MVPAGWLGAMTFLLALALAAWAIVTITRASSNVPTNLPTITIVQSGPYCFTRNPIYLGMFLGLIGLTIACDNLWLLMMPVPFAPSFATAWWPARKPISSASSVMYTVATARAYCAGCSAPLINLRPAARAATQRLALCYAISGSCVMVDASSTGLPLALLGSDRHWEPASEKEVGFVAPHSPEQAQLE